MDAASDSVSAFFLRHGFQPAATRTRCLDFARVRYGDVREVSSQGYCSYTLLAGHSTVVQFRPESHHIHVRAVNFARRASFNLAPETRFLGVVSTDPYTGRHLLAYSMRRMPGVSLSDLRSAGRALSGHQRKKLVAEFARFLYLSFIRCKDEESLEMRGHIQGRVGKSLRWRLEIMSEELPPRFRPAVEDVLANLQDIENLPWVLTYVDVVPGNVMVEAPSEDPTLEPGGTNEPERSCWPFPGSLRGLLDWAEAEFLPFGVGIAGAEELFGESSQPWDPTGPYPPQGSRFEYYPDANDLRQVLWDELLRLSRPLRDVPRFRETVERARVMGILLRHGIAFDDGRLDRVVQEDWDDEEIQRLDAFLSGTSEPGVLFEASKSPGDRAVLEPAQSTQELSLEDRSDEPVATPVSLVSPASFANLTGFTGPVTFP